MKTVELFEKMFGQQNSDESAQKWYSQPEWYCAKAYRSTQKIGSGILTFKDPLIANQWKEVSEILQRENIAEFIYGAKDPDLYLHLLELQNLGWRLKQMCVVPISPFQATHNLSSPAIVLAFAPDETVGVNAGTSKNQGQTIHITATDLVASAIIERLRVGKRSWISLPTLEKYAQEVTAWWESKGYSDIRSQVSEDDWNEVVAHYPEYFERLRARGTTGEEKEFIARKEGVSEQELRSRFYDALPIIYLTALSESWQILQAK